MLPHKLLLSIFIAVMSSSLTGVSAFSNLTRPIRTLNQAATLEQVTRAGNEAIVAGDWAAAESHFREAIRLAPTQGFWRIQLVLVLGHQKKWKEAFKELDPLMRNKAVDWILTFNDKLPDGKVAFVNTETFSDEQQGIPRYVTAVKQKAKVGSVASDIGEKLDTYARQHKIALMYDISKFKKLPFERGNTTDATSDFISYYNAGGQVQQYGTVYLYRAVDTYNYGNIVVLNPEAVVYLDGKEFLSMPERTFIGFKVPVGRYLLQTGSKARWPLEVNANTTQYLRIEQVGYPTAFQSITGRDEKGALEAIRKSYSLDEKKIKTNRFEAIRKPPN